MNNKPKFVLGTFLSEEGKREAKALFTNRFTLMYRPRWAFQKMENGGEYKPQFKDDEDWLANTYFAAKKDGTLDKRVSFCQGEPTWPS